MASSSVDAVPSVRGRDAKTTVPVTEKKQIVLVTYNVWFNTGLSYNQRNRAIFRILCAEKADLICLQEVLPEFVTQLLDQAWVSEFAVSDTTGKSCKPYGVYMLVRKCFKPTFEEYSLPTNMGRKLLTATMTIDGDPVTVGTVHLESLSERNRREGQLKIASSVLGVRAKASHHCILAGDFNFDSHRPFSGRYQGPQDGVPAPGSAPHAHLENHFLAKHLTPYVDVWAHLHPPGKAEETAGAGPGGTSESRGFTFDSARNPMLSKYEQMRYDRVMFRQPLSPTTARRCWAPTSIRIVGTKRLALDPPAPSSGVTPPVAAAAAAAAAAVLPSDHFGLSVTFELADLLLPTTVAARARNRNCSLI